MPTRPQSARPACAPSSETGRAPDHGRQPIEVVPIHAGRHVQPARAENHSPQAATALKASSGGRPAKLSPRQPIHRQPRRNDRRLTGKPVLASRACRNASRVSNYALILVTLQWVSSLFCRFDDCPGSYRPIRTGGQSKPADSKRATACGGPADEHRSAGVNSPLAAVHGAADFIVSLLCN